MTAEEFFEDNKLIPFHTDSFHYNEIYEIMKTFAKYHVEQALKKASKKTPTNVDLDTGRYVKVLYQPLTLENDIISCYPLNNIK
jgi:hypothetical protein